MLNMMEVYNKTIMSIQDQRNNVTAFYNGIASVYEKEIEGKAENQFSNILLDIYKRYNIIRGDILDIGCGTGKLKEYLGNSFTYTGIDISPLMLQEAKNRGFEIFLGPAEEVIKRFPDKSIKHIVASSSLYFMSGFNGLVKEIERVASESFFMTLEQFDTKVMKAMRIKGIELYNHPASRIENPTELYKDVYLWKRPGTGEKIYGDIVFKRFS